MQETEKDKKLQSLGPITSLFVTTKAPQVLPALQLLLPRLSKDSTIVLLQNGAGLIETLVQELFPDEDLRPNFILGTNSHGVYIKNWGKTKAHSVSERGMHTVWAGIGEIAFAVLPNTSVRDAIQSFSQLPNTNPLLNPLSRLEPKLEDLSSLSTGSSTDSLHTTVSALLACTPLRPRWVSLSTMLTQQKQKIAVNAVVNSLTSIFDIQNGVLLQQHAERIAYRICKEATDVFAEQTRRQMLAVDPSSDGQERSSEDEWLLQKGSFPPGHLLHVENLLDNAMQITQATSKNVSSTLQDIRAGKPTTEMSVVLLPLLCPV